MLFIKNNPLITVYITNYNYASYLEEAFYSLINQTYKNLDIIIIDDGSIDNSINIIKEITVKFPNVRSIFQKNKGLNKTNNVAIKNANGKYIMRLDADDILVPTAIEKMVSVIEKNEKVGLVFPDYFLMDEKGYKFSAHKRYNFDTDVSLYDKPAHGACTLIRLDFLKKVNGYDEDFSCQDGYEIWLKFIKNFKVKNINEPLFYYRQHANNLTKNEFKILSTRAKINKKSIKSKNIKIESILIIPVRFEKKYLLKLNNKTFLERKIDTTLETEIAKKIIITSSSKELKLLVENSYSQNNRVQFIERPSNLEKRTTPLAETLLFVFSKLDSQFSKVINTIQIVSLDFPLVESYSIDDAVNTMYLFNSDSIISVREDNHLFFQHHGQGLKTIFNQHKFTKLERETLFKSTGGISVVRKEIFDATNEIITGRVGHLMIEEKAGLELSSQFSLEIIKKIVLNE